MDNARSPEQTAIAELEEAGRTLLGYTRPRVLTSSGTFGLENSHHVEVALVDQAFDEVTHPSGIGGEAASRTHWSTSILLRNDDGSKDADHRVRLIRSLTEAIRRRARNEAR